VRTTVDLSPTLLRRLRAQARREGISLEQAINRVLQRGLDARQAPRTRPRPLPVFSMGSPHTDAPLDKALALASGLEDDQQLRKLDRDR
jgi:hypothetical protein